MGKTLSKSRKKTVRHMLTVNRRVLRVDPTRTGTLRRQLVRELRRRFARLKLKVVDLVLKEDALGLRERRPLALNEFNPDQPRDETGKFAAIGAALSGAEHAVVSVVGAGFAKLPTPVQKVVSATIKTAFAVWTAGQAMAERVAKERGATPEQAASLRAVLARADLIAFKVAKGGAFSGVPGAGMATAISGSIPVASAGYLAYSTATNPLATYRAARGLVKDAVAKMRGTKKSEQRPAFRPSVTQIGNAAPDVDTLVNALANHDYADWYTALLCAALDETDSIAEAVQVADAVYAENPETTANAWVTTEHDQRIFIDDETGEVQPSGPKGGKSGGTLKDADVLAKVKTLGAKQSGLVKLEDLGRDLNTTPAELHKTLEKLWRERKVTMSAAEGRRGLSEEAQRWQMTEPGGGGSAAKLGHVELRTNALTANDRWRFRTDPEKIAEFQKWLRETIGKDLLGADTERLWTEYVRRGYAKGAGRAYDDFVARHPEVGGQPLDFYRGTREGFLRSSFGRPESVEKVKLLAGRAMDDLEGVTSEMSTRMVRHLTDGLVRGQGPKAIARALADDIDGIGRSRAETIARTELIRVHAESQLDALEALGVEEVGVMVEWSTAQDEAVCELCEPLEGVVLRIDEARGMLPRHPNCRCAFLPANVAEDKSDQQRGQKTVEKAIRRSRDEGDDDFGPGAPISKARPKSVLNAALDRFSAALNRFCPTGEGGGVDPTCGEGEGYPDEFRAPKKEQTEALKLAEAKVANAPKPSAEDVVKARKELEAARRGEGRAGGESRGGSAASRRKQRENLFNEFGGAEKGYVVCPWTGLKMHHTDDPKLNPKGYPKFERGKIFVKCQGGGYQLHNLIPESFAANRTRNDKRLRKENSKGC